ncbi:hypothetical protein HS048_26835 [Planomonospora sp. ID91781]|uniref:hypothetical protein n=1 Tax=Planomonospora TaxID=1998 RepID=UPI0012F8198D|nr:MULTISPECIES: hypothetical protein [Planomonospora]MBG0824328.1 hypothetical protein [Planomonospora sp. ID91781]
MLDHRSGIDLDRQMPDRRVRAARDWGTVVAVELHPIPDRLRDTAALVSALEEVGSI